MKISNELDFFSNILLFQPLKIYEKQDSVYILGLNYAISDENPETIKISDYYNKGMVYNPCFEYLCMATKKETHYIISSPIITFKPSKIVDKIYTGIVGNKYSIENGVFTIIKTDKCKNNSIESQENQSIKKEYLLSGMDFSIDLKKYLVDILKIDEKKKNLVQKLPPSILKIKNNNNINFKLCYENLFGKKFLYSMNLEEQKFVQVFGYQLNKFIETSVKNDLLHKFSSSIPIITKNTNKKKKKKIRFEEWLARIFLIIFFDKRLNPLKNDKKDIPNRRINFLVKKFVDPSNLILQIIVHKQLSSEEVFTHFVDCFDEWTNMGKILLNYFTERWKQNKNVNHGDINREHYINHYLNKDRKLLEFFLTVNNENTIRIAENLILSIKTLLKKIETGKFFYVSFNQLAKNISQEQPEHDSIEFSVQEEQKDLGSNFLGKTVNNNNKQKERFASFDTNILSKYNFLDRIRSSNNCFVLHEYKYSIRTLAAIFSEIIKTNTNKKKRNFTVENEKTNSGINEEKNKEQVKQFLSSNLKDLFKLPIVTIPFYYPIQKFRQFLNFSCGKKFICLTRDINHHISCNKYYNIYNITIFDLVDLLNEIYDYDRISEKPKQKLCLNKILGVNEWPCNCCSFSTQKHHQDYLNIIFNKISKDSKKDRTYDPEIRYEKYKKYQTPFAKFIKETSVYTSLSHLVFLDTHLYGAKELSNILEYVSCFKINNSKVASKIVFFGDCDSKGCSSEFQVNIMRSLSQVKELNFTGMKPIIDALDQSSDSKKIVKSLRCLQLGNNLNKKELEDVLDGVNNQQTLLNSLNEKPHSSIRTLINNVTKDNSLQQERWLFVDIFDVLPEKRIPAKSEKPFEKQTKQNEENQLKYYLIGINNIDEKVINFMVSGTGGLGKRTISEINKNDTKETTKIQTLLEFISINLERNRQKKDSLIIYSEWCNSGFNQTNCFFSSILREYYGEKEKLYYSPNTGNTYLFDSEQIIEDDFGGDINQHNKNQNNIMVSIKKFKQNNLDTNIDKDDVENQNNDERYKYLCSNVKDHRFFDKIFDPIKEISFVPTYQKVAFAPHQIIIYFCSHDSTWQTIMEIIKNCFSTIIIIFINNEKNWSEVDSFHSQKSNHNIDIIDKNNYNQNILFSQINENRYYAPTELIKDILNENINIK